MGTPPFEEALNTRAPARRASGRRRCAVLARTVVLLFLAASAASAQKPGALVSARRGMAVSACERASAVGARIMREGGNAVDAAVAMGFALAVTYPSAGNLGGGAYIIIRMADGREAAIDARETAPAAATATMYLDATGAVLRNASLRGPRAAGVPGSVDGLLTALARFGSLDRARVLAPALELADAGYRLKKHEAMFLESQRPAFAEFPSTLRVYGASPHREGSRFRQPDLAAALRRIAREGRDGFYLGETAEYIVRQMREGGGLITHADLAGYSCIVRKPLHGSYRDRELLTMPPSSAGGIGLVQMLNILERHDIAGMGAGTPATLHLLAEAMRRAYADRWKYLGDPAYVDIPQERLVSKDYAGNLDTSIDAARATPSAAVRPGGPAREGGGQTTHYSVADRWGNAVSVTTTLNSICGGKCVVDGAGFLLNNEMDDFTIKPGEANQFGLVGSDANRIEAGKRMLSSMTPTIVLRGGAVELILGSPGGSTITTTVLQVLLNILEFAMPLDRAVSAPRMHHQWMPDSLYHEPRAMDRAAAATLAAMGHVLKERPAIGRVDAVYYHAASATWFGCSDRRGHGAAIGY
ncbi:MAG: gamma-glutamyltransferase [Ignavibacteria bacterium]|nr:gamma-glutamyltransferase [Ignavibacteria bacterium]